MVFDFPQNLGSSVQKPRSPPPGFRLIAFGDQPRHEVSRPLGEAGSTLRRVTRADIDMALEHHPRGRAVNA
jgi:hypothetical protein